MFHVTRDAQLFNVCEGVLWLTISVCCVLCLFKVQHTPRVVPLTAGVIFVLFGISDFIEIGTGAWWRPWWLLLWKAACLVALLSRYGWHVTIKRRHIPPSITPD